MTHKHWIPSLLAGLALTMLAACGGGATFGGGISGSGKPGLKVGDNGADGAVLVGGTSFDSAMAVITIGGAAATLADVKAGHVALVEGLIDGALGVADRVTIEQLVQGELTAKLDANRLRVQGQIIQIDEKTVFESGISPASPDGLVTGDLLKIYGFVKGRGQALATRVERAASLGEFRIIGVAENVREGDKTFDIGTQPIDHGMADVSELPGGDPANGQLVSVRGSTTLSMNGEVVAHRVSPLGLDDRPDNDESEIEGFVTAILSATEFRLGAVTVRTSGITRFEGGTPADVVVGARVEVDGMLGNGVLAARKVEFESSVELESNVDRVVGETITLVGLPGITIDVNSLTEFDEDASSLADILPGDHVRIRGRKTGTSSVVASRVKETGADTDVILQGPVDASPTPQNPFLSILGVLINTSGIAESEFKSPENEALGRANFFQRVAPGVIVKLAGTLVGSAPSWESAELEDVDD